MKITNVRDAYFVASRELKKRDKRINHCIETPIKYKFITFADIISASHLIYCVDKDTGRFYEDVFRIVDERRRIRYHDFL